MISDGAECLKRLKTALPQPATHILDWFHIAMKLRPIEQIAASVSRRPPQDAPDNLAETVESVRWLLWNGQTDRALDLINHLLRLSQLEALGSTTCHLFRPGLMNLTTYIEQNRNSIANYGERYRAGKRIA